MFIDVEGIDGSGKGSQVKLLEHYLIATGKKVWITKEPTDSPIGKLIREIQRGYQISNPDECTMMYLYAADRAEHLKGINYHLNQGEIVITDRYCYSSEAYQDFRDKYVKAWEINEDFIKPDYTFILDIPAEESLKRIESRGEPKEIFEKQWFLEKVRERYKDISNKYNNTYLIDGMGTPEEVFERIKEILRRK